MNKRFDTKLDFNFALRNVTFRVIEIGERKPFSNSEKALADVKDYPYYARLDIVEDPSGINNGAELQIKLRNIDGLEKEQEFKIAPDERKIIGGYLVFWSKQGKLRGKDWIFTNVSAKGDRIDDWR